jgi:ABC-2 type transport system ATP-binding protein
MTDEPQRAEGAPPDRLVDDRGQLDTSADDRRPEAPHADVVVSMRNVSRAFDKRTVVRGIDLTVFAGTILGVIGPSGAGKTTTIRMLTGALEPTSGEIEVLGQRPTSFRARIRERIGYMPQQFALYPDLTARENIDFVASLFGLLLYRRRRRVREVLKLVQLWDARDTRAGRLSGGMQRRLELASALVHDPTLLILDEPTAGIDPLLRVTIWEELHRLRDAGRTLLVTTQYVHEAEECDQVALIAHGRLIALAPPDELRRSATGGDVIEVETTGMFEGSTLEGVQGVIAIRQLEGRRFRVIVDEAAKSLPAIVDAVGAAGGDVASAREVRQTFDEVFAELVARAGEADADGEGDAGSNGGNGRETAA